MRFPHIINNNTRIVYTPSDAALQLQDEVNRTVKAENFEWDKELCPPLVTLCIQTIADDFKAKQIIDELPCADRLHLLEVLSTDLELEIAVPLIEEEIYWQRRYKDHFDVVKETKHLGWTWKCLYLERHVRKMLEEAQPQYADEDTMDDILKLVSPFIHKLMITELQSWKPPLTWEKQDIPSIYPSDHIDFNPIFIRLDLIEELDISYGMKNVETNFTWNMFKLSVVDCRRLGKAVLPLKLMKIFRLHRCAVDDDKLRALTQNLIKHKTLTEIDLSHCLIGDQGALCIAKLMLTQQTIRKIILANNKIAEIGAVGIGFALLEESCCQLVHLDLRLNPLRHAGVMGIFRALIRGDKPEELNLSACQFEELTALRLTQVLKLNSTLKWLDISCNWFDENASQEMLNAMTINKTLEWLDMRDTNISHETLEGINKMLSRNRLGLEDIDESIIESEDLNIDLEDIELKSVEVQEIVRESSEED